MLNFKSAESDLDYDMAAFLKEYGANSPTNTFATGNDVITLTPPEPTDENLTDGQSNTLADMLAKIIN